MNASTLSSAERRERARTARDAFPPMGVYAVRNRAGAALRVLASRNVHAAISRAQFELKLGGHADKALQAEWARDPAQWNFEVLQLVKERKDEPAFDYGAELRELQMLWRAELGL